MGVSASGKTALAGQIAARLGLRFVDADDLHPPANIARMSAGLPLDEDHRAPWLDLCAAALGAGGVVLACSALRRAHRARLRAAAPDLRVIWLDIAPEQAAARMAARPGHFMPAQLAASQFATLEPPGQEEPALRLEAMQPPAALLAAALAAISAGWSGYS